eukprot:TRINITY_DN54528_c0_g1_i1.p1 TRINITY_DN54528_c0_g1~~TRINITY_DN54528_c0_g1_i1.p1  ORF type:complete len:324 (+),score=-67.79 TRINITY_DN54528_c0_g1_i1:259-1230(+)
MLEDHINFKNVNLLMMLNLEVMKKKYTELTSTKNPFHETDEINTNIETNISDADGSNLIKEYKSVGLSRTLRYGLHLSVFILLAVSNCTMVLYFYIITNQCISDNFCIKYSKHDDGLVIISIFLLTLSCFIMEVGFELFMDNIKHTIFDKEISVNTILTKVTNNLILELKLLSVMLIAAQCDVILSIAAFSFLSLSSFVRQIFRTNKAIEWINELNKYKKLDGFCYLKLLPMELWRTFDYTKYGYCPELKKLLNFFILEKFDCKYNEENISMISEKGFISAKIGWKGNFMYIESINKTIVKIDNPKENINLETKIGYFGSFHT